VYFCGIGKIISFFQPVLFVPVQQSLGHYYHTFDFELSCIFCDKEFFYLVYGASRPKTETYTTGLIIGQVSSLFLCLLPWLGFILFPLFHTSKAVA